MELALLVALLVGWAASDGRPAGALRDLLVASSTLAMGIQTGAYRSVRQRLTSTTYLTGTTVALIAELIEKRRINWPDVAMFAALPAGAVVSSLVIVTASGWAPVVPVVTLLAVLGGAAVANRSQRRRT